MKKAKYYIGMMIITSIIWYLTISFIQWDILWAKEIPNYEVHHRVLVVLVVFMKFLIDQIIWLWFEEELIKEGKFKR